MPVEPADVARARTLVALRRFRDVVDLLVPKGVPFEGPPQAAFLLAQAHLALKEPHMALGAAEHGLAREPGSTWGHRLRSRSLSGLGRHAEATAAARHAIELAPTDHLCHLTLADAFLDRQMAYAAHEPAASAIQLAPADADVHVLAGRIALAEGRLDDAADAFEHALSIEPTNAAARNNLGIVALRRQDFEGAQDHFVDAIKLDPRGPGGRNVRQVARVQRWRMWSRAVVGPLAISLGCWPDNGAAWIALLVALRWQLGDPRRGARIRWVAEGVAWLVGATAAIALTHQLVQDLPHSTRVAITAVSCAIAAAVFGRRLLALHRAAR